MLLTRHMLSSLLLLRERAALIMLERGIIVYVDAAQPLSAVVWGTN